MTNEEFIKVLEGYGYPYEIERDKIVFTHKGHVNLESLKTLPPGVQFNNGGHVWLHSLKILPPGVEFNNGGSVRLDSLKILPPGVEFNNGGDDVYLGPLIGILFHKWSGNIEGIDSKRLLNVMINKRIFER